MYQTAHPDAGRYDNVQGDEHLDNFDIERAIDNAIEGKDYEDMPLRDYIESCVGDDELADIIMMLHAIDCNERSGRLSRVIAMRQAVTKLSGWVQNNEYIREKAEEYIEENRER